MPNKSDKEFYKWERMMVSFGYALNNEGIFEKLDDNYMPNISVDQAKEIYNIVYDD